MGECFSYLLLKKMPAKAQLKRCAHTAFHGERLGHGSKLRPMAVADGEGQTLASDCARQRAMRGLKEQGFMCA